MKVFDLHIDLSTFCLTTGRTNIKIEKGIGRKSFPDQVDIPRLKKGEVKSFLGNMGTILVSGKDFIVAPDPLSEFIRQLAFYKNISLTNKLSIEGIYFIKNESDLKIVPFLKKSGVASASLTWNFSNKLGAGLNEEKSENGLTPLGKEFIRVCEKNKIVIDAVHSNRKTFQDIIKFSKRPVMVSHTASYEIAKHPRNMTRKEMRQIANTGGLIGLCFVRDFIGGDTFESAIASMKDLVKNAGINHVAIGSDFDGMDWSDVMKDFPDISVMQKFVKVCRKAGFKETELEKIFFKNADNFFKINT